MKSTMIFFFTLAVTAMSSSANPPPTPAHQVEALRDFYNATNGPQWLPTCNEFWLSTTLPCCDWSGVVCDETNHVIALLLDNCNLDGTLTQSLGDLPTLQRLKLSNNKLRGALPHWTSLTSVTTIELSRSNLESWLPDVWRTMTSLETLNLAYNQLTSTLPDSWGSGMQALVSLSLTHNKINSTLPESWASLSSLQHLALNDNTLSTTLPVSWGHQLNKLAYVDLSNTFLFGTVPSSWCRIMAGYLDVSHNNLDTLEDFYDASCTSIGVLNISYNAFDNAEFPLWSTVTESAGQIYASHNKLLVPCGWRLHGELLDLSFNTIMHLPQSKSGCAFVGTFHNTNLAWCQLAANFSDVLSYFTNVTQLNLAGNPIVGDFPPSEDVTYIAPSCSLNQDEDCACLLKLDNTLVSGTVPDAYCGASLSLSFYNTSLKPNVCEQGGPYCQWVFNSTVSHKQSG